VFVLEAIIMAHSPKKRTANDPGSRLAMDGDVHSPIFSPVG